MMKAKPTFLIQQRPELSVKTLTARVRESAERRRAASSSPEGEGGLPLENVLMSQADLNGVVAGSLRLVALHLQYAREQFDALEQSMHHGEAERERADRLLSERLEQLSTTIEGVKERVETIAGNLAAFEQRVASEIGELRRSLQALSGAAASRGAAE